MAIIRVKPMRDLPTTFDDLAHAIQVLLDEPCDDLSVMVEHPSQVFGNRYDVIVEVLVPNQCSISNRQQLLNAAHEAIATAYEFDPTQMFVYLKTYGPGEVCDRGTFKHWQDKPRFI